ncbi:866_t:CDS:1, partial [Gigaspora margarita]
MSFLKKFINKIYKKFNKKQENDWNYNNWPNWNQDSWSTYLIDNKKEFKTTLLIIKKENQLKIK